MLNSKKQEKIEKILGNDTLQELEGLNSVQLKERVAFAEGAIKQVQDELEANPNYQEMKENLKALSFSVKEVKKRQKAIVQYSLHLLEESDK
jgi:uncharacterized membrane protein YecN with MAPEG domain